ncbi:MAG: substrate-binding domain-containing protein [Phycisphaerae bacterium]|jgi:ribose transport system substrate-binding protein|nr:substrate-binding domain-containing protein [Phycisphaerae bacterium]
MKKLLIPLILLAVAMVATNIARQYGETEDPGFDNAAASVGQIRIKQRPPFKLKVKPPAKKSDQLYVEVSALGNLDYFHDHKLGLRMVGELLGVKTEYVGPAAYDIPAMITAFELTLAKKNLMGIVVVGFERSLEPSINKAIAMGIPVVIVDADLPQSNRLAFVGTGNAKAGYMGGMKLAELIGGKGKVALMTRSELSNLRERISGYKAALSQYKDIKLVQIVDTQSDPVVAAQVAATVLQRHPDLAGLGCVEASGGTGAATAVREAGLVGKVKIVAMDRGNELQLIKDGVIDATVVQQTALMPLYAVRMMHDLVNLNIPISSDNSAAGVSGVPSDVDTGIILVDKNNCEYFMRK